MSNKSIVGVKELHRKLGLVTLVIIVITYMDGSIRVTDFFEAQV